MGFFKDLGVSISSYGRAIEFIFKHKFYYYFLTPLLLNILLFGSGFFAINNFAPIATTHITNWVNAGDWNFWGASVLHQLIVISINTMLYLSFLLLFAFLGGFLVLIILSPLLSIVSEKTENILYSSDYPFSFNQLLKDSWRGVRLAIRNFMIEFAAIILLFLFSLIPLVGIITAPILFFISSYFYGFSFIDYTSERRKLNFEQRINYVKRNKGIAIGNGLPFALCLLIPFIGVSLAGFLSIISTVAATLAVFQKEELDKQNQL